MEAYKYYQLEKFEFIDDNKDSMVDLVTIESWEDTSAVTFFGLDGNIMYESSIDKINDDEYPEWCEPYLKAIHLI